VERPDWAPAGIDIDRPSIARVYDCFLGGSHNFACDRQVVQRMQELTPNALQTARANREFLARAVRYCVQAGVRQFLDIGSGIPTVGNVHEVARQIDPAARVLYVDSDAVAVAHSEAILHDDDTAAVIEADLREPRRILQHPAARGLLNLDQPLGLVMVAVLHFIPDSEDPAGLIDQFAGPMAPGSHLVLSHGTTDGPLSATMGRVADTYRQTVGSVTARSREEVLALFNGFDLVPPGLTWAADWAPPGSAPPPLPEPLYGNYAGVGRKDAQPGKHADPTPAAPGSGDRASSPEQRRT
jgi:hypothetical protein